MSRTTYAPKQTYTGNGTLATYTFDFKIEESSQLEIVEMDNSTPKVEIRRIKGDDVYLTDITFDSVKGGGSITLPANLQSGYDLILILANDAPTQPYQFANKLSFNLRRIEAAYDWLAGAIQRLTYKTKQSMRIHDSDDENTINTMLPPDLPSNFGKVLKVNDTGDGFEYGPDADSIGAASEISADFTVTIPSQGRFTLGDTVLAGTTLEEVIRDMLQQDTPPTFTLAGSGSTLVESGTLIAPMLTPTYTANDAGPANNYSLRRGAVPIYSDTSATPFTDAAFNIVDQDVSYQATLDYDANLIPAGSLISNTITYRGRRAAFWGVGGDPVNIRSNANNLVGVAGGSALVDTGDGVSLDIVFSYPATLGDPTSLFLSNTGGNFDITGDLVRLGDQPVNDAVGANPVTYRVYSYTALIPLKVSDTLTLTI